MVSAKRLLLPALLLLAVACGKETAWPSGDKPLRDSRIPSSQVPLYGDLSSYDLIPDKPGTRTDDKSVALESLLDTEKARTVCFGNVLFSQIPFLPDGELAEYGDDLSVDIGSATAIRKFCIETVQDGIRYRFVATMVAEAQYADNHSDYDYMDMANFTGVVLLSTTEGSIFRVEHYRNGLIREAVLLRKGELSGKSGLHFVKLYRQETETRSGGDSDGWVLESAVCLAEKPESDKAEGSAILVSHPQYTVSITTNLPEYVDVQGAGTYSSGSWAALGCLPKHTLLSLDFGRWTGTFFGEKRPFFPWKVTCDITATAWYEDDGPCVDLERGVVNPLKRMSVAATGSGSYVNGTYKALRGYYEDGTPRYHWGIDLYAKVGTPVYSMYSGTVVRTETGHPDRYEEKSYGNVIVTENEVKGYDRKVYLQYSHLQYGMPVAVNPRTGKPFAKGDRVFAGDLIGYTGRTGNAFNDIDVPNKHLDLMAAFEVDVPTGKPKSGSLTDPAPFLNGTLDLDNLQRKQGRIENIRCD